MTGKLFRGVWSVYVAGLKVMIGLIVVGSNISGALFFGRGNRGREVTVISRGFALPVRSQLYEWSVRVAVCSLRRGVEFVALLSPHTSGVHGCFPNWSRSD